LDIHSYIDIQIFVSGSARPCSEYDTEEKWRKQTGSFSQGIEMSPEFDRHMRMIRHISETKRLSDVSIYCLI